MTEKETERYLFEEMPVPQAVATLAIPTIISQIVTVIYNLADTFFIGQLGDPYMVAAVSLVSPWFNLLTALGNLFGVGGGSLIPVSWGHRITGISSIYLRSACGAVHWAPCFSPCLPIAPRLRC